MANTNKGRKASTKATARKAKSTKLTPRQQAAHKAWETMRARKGFDPGAAARKAWETIRAARKAAAKAAKGKAVKAKGGATHKARKAA